MYNVSICFNLASGTSINSAIIQLTDLSAGLISNNRRAAPYPSINPFCTDPSEVKSQSPKCHAEYSRNISNIRLGVKYQASNTPAILNRYRINSYRVCDFEVISRRSRVPWGMPGKAISTIVIIMHCDCDCVPI